MKLGNLTRGKWGVYGFIAGALVVLLLLAGLPACAPAAEEEVAYDKYVASLPEGCLPVPQDCFDQAMVEGQLNIYNWAEWFPQDLYDDFTKEFGIEVVQDYFGDYEEMLAKFKLYPELEYDIVVPGTKTFGRLEALGVVQELNHDWIPNVQKYQTRELAEKIWVEPWETNGFRYSVPFDFGVTCYAYNSKYVDDPRIPSWSALLEPDEKYWGRITMLDDIVDGPGAALIYLGYSYNSNDEDELREAKELLLEQKPKLLGYDSAPRRAVMEEEVWIYQIWTGDVWWHRQDMPSIELALPAEGSVVATDAFVIPAGSPNTAAAHLFMNYYFRPQVNAYVTGIIGYAPVNAGAFEYLPEEVKNFPGLTISAEYLQKVVLASPEAYSGEGLELRSALWEELKS